MHEVTGDLREAVFEYARTRLSYSPAPLDSPKSESELTKLAGQTITEAGLGGGAALDLFGEVLAPSTISTDHPGYLSFIPSAPTEASKLFDLIVSASAIYGGSWLEGAGAVYAENQVIEWLARETGLPETSGGVFVQGGTIGNLSALVTAREDARRKFPGVKQWAIACSEEAHSSIATAAQVMDVELVTVAVREDLRMYGDDIAAAIDAYHAASDRQICAVVATAGTTNLGVIDDLVGAAKAAHDRNIWFHVDGAYGLAALCAPSVRPLFNGIELADSFIVDPHKWLFAPFDACALIYRNPKLAKRAHLQKAAYLETLDEDDEWNPSDYAIHLTRRARGLPFWFSLAAHGTDEYAKAMERTMDVAKDAAEQVRSHPNLKLVIEPSLSIVAFERVGWSRDDYEKWSDKLLADQIGFVTPSAHKGAPILRFAIVNPWTKESDISAILATL